MCGLVGMAGFTGSAALQKVFRELLVIDQIRGYDSTGVAAIRVPVTGFVNDRVEIELEHDMESPRFLWDGCYKSRIFDAWGETAKGTIALIGHNRAQTMGKVSIDNAHPFTFGDITGVHNGTLSYWYDLEGYDDFDVDSKALLNTIDKKGIEHTWKSFVGAAAVVYWDDKDQTLNFVRNKERPLYMIRTKDKKTMIWASEAWMIEGICRRNNIKLEVHTEGDLKDCPKFQALPIETLHTFSVSDDGCKLRRTKKLEVMQNFTVVRGWGGYNYNQQPRGPFKLVKGWKKDLVRGALSPTKIILKSLRELTSPNGTHFRATMFSQDKPDAGLGYCDIYPSNKKEYMQLLDWEEDDVVLKPRSKL